TRTNKTKQIPDSSSCVRRRLEHSAAQYVGDCFDGPVVVRQPFGVARAKPREFALRGLESAADFQVSIFERQKIGERPLDDAQAVLRESQLADHLRLQQAHGV